MSSFSDTNIVDIEEILTPRELLREIPVAPRQEAIVGTYRKTIEDILDGRDMRLLAVVGPCSVHDIVGATEFASRLAALSHELCESLFIVMRVYFEKPREICGIRIAKRFPITTLRCRQRILRYFCNRFAHQKPLTSVQAQQIFVRLR